MALTPRQQRFAEAYATCLNAAEAARQAGYSEASARQQGSRLLSYADVQEEIEARARELCAELGLEAQHVLRGLETIATFDIADLIQLETGNPKAVHEIPEALRRAIAGIKYARITTTTERRVEGSVEVTETVRTQVVDIRMPDRLRAYELLGRHLSLFDQGSAPPQEMAQLIVDGRRIGSEEGSSMSEAKTYQGNGGALEVTGREDETPDDPEQAPARQPDPAAEGIHPGGPGHCPGTRGDGGN